MKRKIRLTEGDLHRIVKETINKVINEMTNKKTFQKLRNNSKIDINKIARGFYPDKTYNSPSETPAGEELLRHNNELQWKSPIEFK